MDWGDTWESFRLGLGAFLTSPGAGILGLVGAAWLTLRGVNKRMAFDRSQAELQRQAEAEKHRLDFARERWQWAYDHLWNNRDILPAPALIQGIRELEALVETEQQAAMLRVFLRYLTEEAEEA